MRRGVAFVLGFITVAVIVSFVAMVAMFFVVSRGPSVPDRATLVVRPGGELVEQAPDDVFGQVLARDTVTVRALVNSLRRAARDERITSVLLLPTTLQSPFWAKVQDVRDAVLEFRRSGKQVIAFLEYGGDREYYLASAADRVFLLPTSPLDLTGVASYEVFLRGALDKIGAVPDFVRVGDYKTAVNTFTESGFTPAHREMTESLNRDMYDQLVRAIAESRRMTEAEVRTLIDQGPFTPRAALQAGLVDDLAYFDQLDDRVPELRGDDDDPRRLEGADYARGGGFGGGRNRVAVLLASGVIASGRSAFDTVNGNIVGSDTMVEQIRRVRDDESVRAVVLRVDSPGGSSVASDVIWRELAITRDQNPSRPLVASMSDLAASGGYYIAMAAPTIVAQPATLTGSIGIFGGKIALGGTAGKLGVTTGTVAAGRSAAMMSPFDTFTPDQRAKLQNYMNGFYDHFVATVAESRGKTPAEIHAVAQGRVWTGRQAREHGLVDALGGLDAAITLAKERAGIPADEDVDVVFYPPRRTLFEALREQFGSAGVRAMHASPLRALVGDVDARALAALTAPARLFRRGEPLALMPFAFVR
ncbi:MAG: signal peptide peptidase SppA [Acidimicrobiia bacterium]|nr:signal peptide peptidase SppA [Acidimicrobiia bacterium]